MYTVVVNVLNRRTSAWHVRLFTNCGTLRFRVKILIHVHKTSYFRHKYMRTVDETLAGYSGVPVWSTVLSTTSRQHPPAQPLWVRRESKKIRLPFFNKAVGTLVGPTHLHVQNSRTSLTRQPTVNLLYALATAFANRKSSRVKPHTSETIATPS